MLCMATLTRTIPQKPYVVEHPYSSDPVLRGLLERILPSE